MKQATLAMRQATAVMKLVPAVMSLTTAIARFMAAAPWLMTAPARFMGAPVRLPCASVQLAPPSTTLVSPVDDPLDASAPHLPAPASSGGAVEAVAQAVAAPADAERSRVALAIVHFVESRKKKEGRDFVRFTVVRRLYGKTKTAMVDDALVDDLTHLAIVRALEAESPPWTVMGVPGWVRRVTMRTIRGLLPREGRRREVPRLQRGRGQGRR